jgi:hypothetical protein
MNLSKKFWVLIGIILFAVAGTGYAENGPIISVRPIPPTNLRLVSELSFGDRREVLYTPIEPCRIGDTRRDPRGPVLQGEVRPYTVSSLCGVPAEAEHVAIQVTVLAVNVYHNPAWNWPGVRLYTTTSNSAQTDVGFLLGGWLPSIVYLTRPGEVSTGSAIVELKPVSNGLEQFKGFEFRPEDGDVHVIVDITGYTLPRQISN